jgi:small subunit ribosomal protein S2
MPENKETLENESISKEPIKLTAAEKKVKIAALKEKAKELEKKVAEDKPVDLKKKVKPEDEERADTLVPIEDYLKSSIHLGTRVITPDMKSFVYKRRADGLAVFNTTLLDEKIREAAEFLSQYKPENVIIVCKREAGWKAVDIFADITGIRTFTRKYPAGILTNPDLEDFQETDLVLICDPWIDKNALIDAYKIKVPVLSICDTNNYTHRITKILPGNNKSAKSLGMIFFLLATLYSQKQKLKSQVPPISEFVENWESLVPPK